MRILVDTNILFSALVFPRSRPAQALLHVADNHEMVLCDRNITELRDILGRYELLELMDFTIGGEMVKSPKPDPEGLNRAIEAVGADRGEVLYCGDTTIDAATAQNGGVDFAAVLNGTTPAEDFGAYPCVHVAPDLLELKSWLGV